LRGSIGFAPLAGLNGHTSDEASSKAVRVIWVGFKVVPHISRSFSGFASQLDHGLTDGFADVHVNLGTVA
jgi:hypothetical protein